MRKKERHRIYTDKQIREITERAAIRGFLHAVTLDIAYHMEDPEFGCDEDRIVNHVETVLKWEQNRKNEHDLTIGKAKKLIEEYTGLIIDYE